MIDEDSITRRLKLRQLKVLLLVIQWGRMARAAEHLSVSQPVVSKTIAELEGSLGLRLLDRTSQGVDTARPFAAASPELQGERCRGLLTSPYKVLKSRSICKRHSVRN